jgi:phosphate transport system substrate-binding protein
VQGSVSDVAVTSVSHASGAATTVSRTNGKDFAKVTADASRAATTYKVTKGDTLSSIAMQHAVDVAELRAWNHLKNDQIKLGQVLSIRQR